MFYSDGANKIKEIFNYEKINISNALFNNLMVLLSKFCTYEEEGRKLRPSILIGNNVQFFLQPVPSKLVYLLSETYHEADFMRIIKSLLPLCNNGWCVFIDIKMEKLEIGFFKQTDTLTISNISDMIFGQSKYIDNEQSLLYIAYRDKSSFRIRGICGTNEIISLGFTDINENLHLADFISKQHNEVDKQNITVFWNAYEELIQQNVHGSICVFLDTSSNIDKMFKCGIKLREPLLLSDSLIKFKKSNDYLDFIKLRDIVDLSLDLMNNDGITVFDKKGNLIAYNVFVKSKGSTQSAGGARRRAAEYILEKKPQGCCAVYFQSQDGDTFLKEI